MPLVLQPTMNDGTREDYEEFLEGVRARRLVAAIEYANAKQLRLDTEADAVQRKLSKAIESLGRQLERMEKLDEQIQETMIKVETYRQEVGFLGDIREKGLVPEGDEDA